MAKNSQRSSGRPRSAARPVARRTRRPAPRTTNNLARGSAIVVPLIASAAAGAALFYLFNPKSGAQRRQMIARAARAAASTSGDSIALAAKHVADHVTHAASAASESGQSVAKNLHDHGSNLLETVRDRIAGLRDSLHDTLHSTASAAGKHASDQIDAARDHIASVSDSLHDAKDRAAKQAERVRHRVNIALGREREHHVIGQSVCAISSLLLGAGLLWVFDPQSGRARRAWLRSVGEHSIAEAGDFVNRIGGTIGRRLRGEKAAQPDSFLTEDDSLAARVRAELDRAVCDANSIDVETRGGVVTLRGRTDSTEICSLGNLVLGMSGVRGLDNQLTAGLGRTTTDSQTPPAIPSPS